MATENHKPFQIGEYSFPDSNHKTATMSLKTVAGVPGAWLIENLLTRDECEYFIEFSESLGFAPKRSNRSGPQIRNNDRVLYNADTLTSDTIQNRIERFLEKISLSSFGKNWELRKPDYYLNTKWRLNRYEVGQQFFSHVDSGYEFDVKNRSLLSLIIYFNDDFEGGETCFYPDGQTREHMYPDHRDADEILFRPQAGAAIIFPHYGPLSPRHLGRPVQSGKRPKYIARTDINFTRIDFPLADILFGGGQTQRTILLYAPPGIGSDEQLAELSQELNWNKLNFGQCVRQAESEEAPLPKALSDFRKERKEWRQKALQQNFNKYNQPSNWLPDEICLEILNRNLPARPNQGLLLHGYPRLRSQSLQLETADWFLLGVIYLDASTDQARTSSEKSPAEQKTDWQHDIFPLVEHYQKRDMVDIVNANQDPQEIKHSIVDAINRRIFNILRQCLPDNIRTLLKGYESDGRSLSRYSKVYRMQSKHDALYLKVGNQRKLRENTEREAKILQSLKATDFPFEYPELLDFFSIGTEISGLLIKPVRGSSIKSLLKQHAGDEKIIRVIIKHWAAALRTIHQYSPPPETPFPTHTIESLLSRAEYRLKRNLVHAGSFAAKYDGDPSLNPAEELAQLREMASSYRFTNTAFLHGDPCAPNLMMDPKTFEVIACVDLPGMGFGDPDWDLALARWSLKHNLGSKWKNELTREYSEYAENTQKLDFMYRLARFIF